MLDPPTAQGWTPPASSWMPSEPIQHAAPKLDDDARYELKRQFAHPQPSLFDSQE